MNQKKPPDGSLTDLEKAKLALDALKFRQTHAWSVVSRYYFAAVIVSVTPYYVIHASWDTAQRVFIPLLVLPMIGCALAFAAVWLYGAEYTRLRPAARTFTTVFCANDEAFREAYDEGSKGLFSPPIGWIAFWALVLTSLVLGPLNIYCVFDILTSR